MSPSSQARASGALSEPLLDQAEAGRRNGSGADEGADSASAVTQQGGQAGRVLLNLLNSGIGSSTGEGRLTA